MQIICIIAYPTRKVLSGSRLYFLNGYIWIICLKWIMSQFGYIPTPNPYQPIKIPAKTHTSPKQAKSPILAVYNGIQWYTRGILEVYTAKSLLGYKAYICQYLIGSHKVPYKEFRPLEVPTPIYPSIKLCNRLTEPHRASQNGLESVRNRL